MNSRVMINIGWARAASTAFRANFLRRHPDILTVGRNESFPATLLQHIKTADDEAFAQVAEQLRSQWEAWLALQTHPLVCLSDEELSIGLYGAGVAPATIAQRCGMLFPGARTLAFVREPVDAIRSFHALAERQAGTGGLPFEAWVHAHFIDPGPGGFAYLFDYATTLRSYLAWQPRRDVIVFAYERLKSDYAGLYADVAQALGIPAQGCAQFPNDILNASPTGCSDMGRVEEDIKVLYRPSHDELMETFGIAFPHAGILSAACPAGRGA